MLTLALLRRCMRFLFSPLSLADMVKQRHWHLNQSELGGDVAEIVVAYDNV